MNTKVSGARNAIVNPVNEESLAQVLNYSPASLVWRDVHLWSERGDAIADGNGATVLDPDGGWFTGNARGLIEIAGDPRLLGHELEGSAGCGLGFGFAGRSKGGDAGRDGGEEMMGKKEKGVGLAATPAGGFDGTSRRRKNELVAVDFRNGKPPIVEKLGSVQENGMGSGERIRVCWRNEEGEGDERQSRFRQWRKKRVPAAYREWFGRWGAGSVN